MYNLCRPAFIGVVIFSLMISVTTDVTGASELAADRSTPLQKGLTAWENHRAEEAALWFSRHIAIAEDTDRIDDSVFFLRGLARLSIGELRPAAEDFREALSLMELSDRSTRAEILRQIGRVHVRLDEPRVALRAFNRSIIVKPNWETLIDRARLHHDMNNFGSAIDDVTAAIGHRPSPALYLIRADYFLRINNRSEARADLYRARMAGASIRQLAEIDARMRAINALN